MRAKSSIFIGIIITAVTSLIGRACGISDTGGVPEGWKGLPLPYYQCGVWGDTFDKSVVWPISAIFINLIFWCLVAYIILTVVYKKRK